MYNTRAMFWWEMRLQNQGILTDEEIRSLCLPSEGKRAMIEPYVPELVREVDGRKVVSYGQSSMGYDIRAGREWYIAAEGWVEKSGVLDPKGYDRSLMKRFLSPNGEPIHLPPYSFAMTHSVERFVMPDNVIGIATGKSSYARSGLIVNITPLEPGWEGYLTIEVINPTPYPIRVYPDEGIAQIIFFRSGSRPRTTYRDRNGKYQGQEKEVVFPA